MSNWKETPEGLHRKLEFKDFKATFAFMTHVAFIAEKMGHHPDWRNVYNSLEITLNTHDQGGAITDKDRKLAQAIDAAYGS